MKVMKSEHKWSAGHNLRCEQKGDVSQLSTCGVRCCKTNRRVKEMSIKNNVYGPAES